VSLGDWNVLVEKGKWVDEDLLYAPHTLDDIKSRLLHVAENPNYPAYLQMGELKKIRRVWMGNVRLYVRVYPGAKILTVLAAVGRGKVKRDERSGALDRQFIHYLLSHNEELRYDRLVPFAPPLPKPQIVQLLPEEKPLEWRRTFTPHILTEEEANFILNKSRPTRGQGADFQPDPFCLQVVEMVSKSSPGERIMVQLPPGNNVWERKDILSLQHAITKTLTFFGYHYSVRFDDLSQKILIVPPDKIDVYCYSQSGRRSMRL